MKLKKRQSVDHTIEGYVCMCMSRVKCVCGNQVCVCACQEGNLLQTDYNAAYSNVNQYYYDTSAAANFTTESGA